MLLLPACAGRSCYVTASAPAYLRLLYFSFLSLAPWGVICLAAGLYVSLDAEIVGFLRL